MRFCTRLLCLLMLSPLFWPSQITAQSSITALVEAYAALQDSLAGDSSPWQLMTREQLAAERIGLTRLQQKRQAWAATASPAERIDGDILALLIQDRLDHLEFERYKLPLNAEGGFLAEVVYRYQKPVQLDAAGLAAYAAALEALPAYFDAQIANLQAGIASGHTHPTVVLQNCLAYLDRFLQTPPESSFLVHRVLNPDDRALILPLVKGPVYAAYKKLYRFLSVTYRPHAKALTGTRELPEGETYYARRVQYFTTLDMTPTEVFETGQKEVARIKEEMEAIIEEVGFKGSFAEFLQFLRSDPQFYAASPEALLHRAAWITKEMEGELPNFFNTLPRIPLTVKPVPTSLAPTYTGGRYSPGAIDPPRAGQYWVNTYKLESRPLYVLPALTLHEGVPGHHLQIMLAAEAQHRSSLRKNAYFSAFGEGWGLYAEYLGEEAGIYHTPYERFGRLTYEMWRACRLVVDPGLHVMGWTRQQAIDFMASNTALSMHEVNTEIDRYIGWPAQAVSYKIGELRIKALRQQAEAELGEGFDLRAFHDLILSEGSVPLLTLDRMVRDWITDQQGE